MKGKIILNKEIKYSNVSIIYNSDIWSSKLSDEKINRIKQMAQFASIFSVLMFVLSILAAIDLRAPIAINIILIPFLTLLPVISFTIRTMDEEYGGYEDIFLMMRRIKNINDIKTYFNNNKEIFEIVYKNGKVKKYDIYSFCKKMRLFDVEITFYGEPYGESITLIDVTDPILANMEVKYLSYKDGNYYKEKVIFYA